MKKYLAIILLVTIAFSSCSKKDSAPFDPVAQAAADDASIKAYLTAHPNITATKDPSGLYYQVITQGTGANASASSTVTVNYTGTLLDGTQFDTTTGRGSFTSALTINGSPQVIQGWVIGVPFVKSGGRILLIIPSALGYGNSAAGSIPANSVLLFTIDVLGVR